MPIPALTRDPKRSPVLQLIIIWINNLSSSASVKGLSHLRTHGYWLRLSPMLTADAIDNRALHKVDLTRPLPHSIFRISPLLLNATIIETIWRMISGIAHDRGMYSITPSLSHCTCSIIFLDIDCFVEVSESKVVLLPLLLLSYFLGLKNFPVFVHYSACLLFSSLNPFLCT